MKKIIFFIFTLVLGASFVISTPTATYAETEAKTEDKCENTPFILGMRPWFYGLVKDENGTCTIKNPNELDSGGTSGIQKFIMTIVLNIIYDLSVIAGILTVIMIIYGAYQFIMAGGDVGKTMKAKKTLTNAIVGLIIAIMAWGVITYISNDFLQLTNGSNAMKLPENSIDVTLRAALQLATSLIGIIAVVFIIYSGIQYTTSSGDAGKIQKAKNTIVYSIIGLAIAILSFAIVTWVLGNVTPS